MATLSEINNSLNRWIVRESNSITDRMFNGSKEKTPVATGYAQSRWEIKNRISSAGQTAGITNDADYIGWLEFGSTHGTEHAMVRKTIQEVKKDYK